jgi:signal peptidase II
MTGSAASSWLKTFAVAGLVLALDQAVKGWARSSLVIGERRDLIWPVDLVHVENTGVAFGALSGSGVIVPLLTLIALAGVLAWFAFHSDTPGAWLPTGLVLGGALGNLIDRARLGAVTDFIKLPNWPAFNAADVAITVGVILLVVVAERNGRAKQA